MALVHVEHARCEEGQRRVGKDQRHEEDEVYVRDSVDGLVFGNRRVVDRRVDVVQRERELEAYIFALERMGVGGGCGGVRSRNEQLGVVSS